MSITDAINTKGFTIVTDVFAPDYLLKLREAMLPAIEKEAAYHGTTDYYYYGSLLLAPIYGGPFLQIFDEPAFCSPFEEILGEECIVYAYTSSSIPPHSSIYTKRIHVDSPRIIKGYHTSLIGLVMLDDFTPENGASYFLPGSQEMETPPSEEYFYEHAEQVTGKAGSVIYFNPRIWHTGGENKTAQWRHSLIIGMVRPWMKQRFDIPRALSDDAISGLTEKSLQKLGFNAQPPVTYDDYFKPPENRTFRQRTV